MPLNCIICTITLNVRYQLTEPLLASVCINLCRGNAFMAQQGLNIYQLYILFQQPGGVSMSELVQRDFLDNAGLGDQLL